MPEPLPTHPDLGQLRTRAKELRRAVSRRVPDALARVAASHPAYAERPVEPARFTLRDAQLDHRPRVRLRVVARPRARGRHPAGRGARPAPLVRRRAQQRHLGPARPGRRRAGAGRPGADALRRHRLHLPLDRGRHRRQPRPGRVPDRPGGAGHRPRRARPAPRPALPRAGRVRARRDGRLGPALRPRGAGPGPAGDRRRRRRPGPTWPGPRSWRRRSPTPRTRRSSTTPWPRGDWGPLSRS